MLMALGHLFLCTESRTHCKVDDQIGQFQSITADVLALRITPITGDNSSSYGVVYNLTIF